MSIYPVKISEWFDEKDQKEIKEFFKDALTLKCKECGKKPNVRGYVYHAFLYGYAMEDYWCSLKCLRK